MTPKKVRTVAYRSSANRVVGRPRKVTDGDIAEILAWHASRETCAQLAKRLGLSQATIRRVVGTRGRHYKKESPTDDQAARSRDYLDTAMAFALEASRRSETVSSHPRQTLNASPSATTIDARY